MTNIRKVLSNEVNIMMDYFILDRINYGEDINDFEYKRIKTITFKNKKYSMKIDINFKKI